LTSLSAPLSRGVRTKGFVDKLKAFAKEKTVPLTLGTIKLISAAAIQKLLL
jgi:hypothetical protein